jgi:signal transduction histidine kinase/ActR/RegA family two-component response regulator
MVKCFGAFWLMLAVAMSAFAQPQAASFDARQHNFSASSFVLNGQWQFVWQDFVMPEALLQRYTANVKFPERWNEQGEYPAKGYATYAATVYLPKDHLSLGIDLPDVYTSYRLYINGALFFANGEPGTTEATTVPRWHPVVLPLPENVDSLHLVFHVANFHHSKGGPYKPIAIGDFETLSKSRKRDTSLDLLMSGALLMGGLFFFGLYLFGKYDRAMLFFSLYCLAYSYRPVGSRLYVLHDIFPELSWFLTTRLEYFSLFAGIGFFAVYTLFIYPKDVNRNILQPLATVCFALAAATWLVPTYYITMTLNPFLVVMFLVVGYTAYVYILAVRRKRLGAHFAAASTILVMVVMAIINLEYFQLLVPVYVLLFAGYVLFLFFQSIVLAFRFASILDEARLAALTGLRAKTEFLSTMSHEIRTPLNAVIGMTHLLLKSKPRQDQEEQLGVLLFSARNLLSIVNDILDYNKIEAGKISFEQIPFDFGLICKNIAYGLQLQATEKGVACRLEIDPKLNQKVIGDPTRLTQVISNLLQNAIKFTKEGWVELRVLVQHAYAGKIQLLVEVEDTGIGIPPEKMEMIFDRFTQADSSTSRSFGGTGLGLSIAKRILEMQNSKLEVRSKVNEGTVFSFNLTLPLSSEATGDSQEKGLLASEMQVEADEALLQGAFILLVEDNPLNVKVAEAFLRRWGADVEVAVNGAEALEKLNTRKHHVVLMDLHMPVLDGYEATEQLRARGETLPIIALTASLPKEVEHEAFSSGLNAVVVKPFNPDELKQVIWRQLGDTSWAKR